MNFPLAEFPEFAHLCDSDRPPFFTQEQQPGIVDDPRDHEPVKDLSVGAQIFLEKFAKKFKNFNCKEKI